MKKLTLGFGLLFTLSLVFSGCKNDDPSTIKIYVRTVSNQLVSSAKVVIIGDPTSDPATVPFVDTVLTNPSGFATFNMEEYFDKTDETVAYFDVLVSKNDKENTEYVRCREHISTVETIILPD